MGVIKLWDSRQTNAVASLNAHDNFVTDMSLHKPHPQPGDDAGVIKLWDSRQTDAVASFDAHDDFVTDMSLHEREGCLLSVSGDGTLSVIDLRTNKVGGGQVVGWWVPGVEMKDRGEGWTGGCCTGGAPTCCLWEATVRQQLWTVGQGILTGGRPPALQAAAFQWFGLCTGSSLLIMAEQSSGAERCPSRCDWRCHAAPRCARRRSRPPRKGRLTTSCSRWWLSRMGRSWCAAARAGC